MRRNCLTIDYDKPFTNWKAFIALDQSIQRDYILGLIANYHAQYTDLAEMWGVSPKTVYRKLYALNLINIAFHGHRPKELSDKWRQFLNQSKTECTHDECVFEDTVLENVLLIISTCPICGKVSLGWRRQPNTKDITEEYDEHGWVYSGEPADDKS